MTSSPAKGSGKTLVIVESPAKAKKLTEFLGRDYVVDASVGHIRDLPIPRDLPTRMKKGPYKRFAVNIEDGFKPYYVVDPGKRAKVRELKAKLKEADALLLATDEDREGEAIAWHLLEVLKPQVPVHRMVFHEITKEAVLRALANTRELDASLVDAQETRRILDRLYGYEVSPVLWRKVRSKLSAGRVQSVATRLVVDRERERMAFVPVSYWSVEGVFAADKAEQAQPPEELSSADAEASFTAKLHSLDGTRVASGKDFSDDGVLQKKARLPRHLDKQAAEAIAGAARTAPARVATLTEKPYTRRPSAPFTTSTLQQEASRKLRLSSRETMRVAQRLYEGGFITYMRTDSTNLAASAVTEARAQAQRLYGANSVPPRPRVYAKKNQSAQEAHEAIRPAGDTFLAPEQVKSQLDRVQFMLYTLIWKRTIASQMADAKGFTATVHIEVPVAVPEIADNAVFAASGTVINFRGFLAAYEEGQDVSRYGGDSSRQSRLPAMREGMALDTKKVAASGHETSPPARYTEASLVKAMEERGIGRPSTYASTIGTILERGYVRRRGPALLPTWLAFAVTRLLEEHFGSLVDYAFTASMEAGLDSIAAGQEDRVHWLQQFYFGNNTTATEGLRSLVDHLGEIDARAISTIAIGDGINVRVGRYGPYVEEDLPAGSGADAKPRRASIPEHIAPDEMTVAKARVFLEETADGGRELGLSERGYPIVAKNGRYGPYVTEVLPEGTPTTGKAAVKPRTGSLLKTMSLATVSLDDALQLLSLPRVVGESTVTTTKDGQTSSEVLPITAQNGRYGPYLKRGRDSRSLNTEEEMFTITLEQAEALYAQPKRRGAKPPLKELGEDPTTGKPVVLKDGRFGLYVTDGETNASLRVADSLESITPERAWELLANRRAAGPAKKKAAKKATRKTTKRSAKKAVKKTTKKAAKKATKRTAKKTAKKSASKSSPF